MANVNKVILIGNVTRDPEYRAFTNGGRVAKFGFAVNHRRKNPQTGENIDEAMFIDCEVFNRGEFKQADLIERLGIHKGSHLFLEGRLQLQSWDDKTTGQKRSKHALIVENFQMLDRRPDGAPAGGAPAARSTAQPAMATSPGYDSYEGGGNGAGGNGGEEHIPF